MIRLINNSNKTQGLEQTGRLKSSGSSANFQKVKAEDLRVTKVVSAGNSIRLKLD